MTRRRLLLFGLLAGLLALGVCGWLLLPRTAITRENAAKIQVGMTLAEVEVNLGGPPRDDTTGPVVTESGYGGNTLWLEDVCLPFGDQRPHIWKSDCVLVLVSVGADGRVANFIAFRQQRRVENSLDMLRRWLRL
jgi:hypothetical protein